MNTKNYIITALLALTPLLLSAQELTVQSFSLSPTEIIPASDQRVDLNGIACALIKVQIVNDIERVEGNVIGDIIKRGTEKWVFVTDGTKELRIYPKNHLPLQIICKDFDIESLDSKRVYILRLSSNQSAEAPAEPNKIQKEPERHFTIPMRTEEKTDYEAIQMGNKDGQVSPPRKRIVFLNIGLGYNALSIKGPSAFIGLNIGAHNIEGGAIIGLNKVEGINFYQASNGAFMGTYDYSAMRFYARYGYDIKAGSSVLLTPQIGAAINQISGTEITRSTSGVNLFGKASGFITSVGCRLSWCLSKSIRLQITPEYDFCIKGDRGFNIIKESNSKIESWSDGLNVNAGLVFHF